MKWSLMTLPLQPRAIKKSLWPKAAIDLHDVPEDGAAAKFDHRLGLGDCLFGESGAGTAGQDYRLHGHISIGITLPIP
jgi:hypothetical protein